WTPPLPGCIFYYKGCGARAASIGWSGRQPEDRLARVRRARNTLPPRPPPRTVMACRARDGKAADLVGRALSIGRGVERNHPPRRRAGGARLGELALGRGV